MNVNHHCSEEKEFSSFGQQHPGALGKHVFVMVIIRKMGVIIIYVLGWSWEPLNNDCE